MDHPDSGAQSDTNRHGKPRSLARRLRLLVAATACVTIVVPIGLLAPAGTASAASGPTTCGGTLASPQSLPAGTYTDVTVDGVCVVNAGQVVVTGNVIIEAGDGLVAAYANNDSGSGTSSLTVDDNINVASGAGLILGCEASAFPCLDDPNPNAPTLNSPDTVQGGIDATGALGVVVHDSTIGTDVVQTGGGGGPSCTPSGIFSLPALAAPPYSDYEDNTIAGNLRFTGVTSCWFGAERNKIRGSATFANGNFTISNASEILSNQVAGNLLCSDNVPAVQFGTSVHGTSNVVGGFATGQCAFGVTKPAPSGTLTPISIPATTPQGYWLAAADGGVFSFGLPFFGSQGGQPLAQPIVGIGSEPGGTSYNLAEANGTVYREGPQALDCTGVSGPLNEPLVGIATAPGGTAAGWQPPMVGCLPSARTRPFSDRRAASI